MHCLKGLVAGRHGAFNNFNVFFFFSSIFVLFAISMSFFIGNDIVFVAMGMRWTLVALM